MLQLAGVALVSAALLMTELALTRIFSVVMYYHFAFLAISIALFGLSASGVAAYVWRGPLARRPTDTLLASLSLVYAACTIVSLFALVRLRVGLTYSPANLALMLTIYALAALPFFSGGLVITLAIARYSSRINTIYAADLAGAAVGCLLLIPLLNALGAPGVVLTAAGFATAAALVFTPVDSRRRIATIGLALLAVPLAGQLSGRAGFDVVDTKGHKGDRVLFSKWNSFSRIGVYDREHGDWSLSPAYDGPVPESKFMDIDSAAATPIPHVAADLSNMQYLRYELTTLAYQLKGGASAPDARPRPPMPGPPQPSAAGDPTGTGQFTSLVIGPGGGRDLASALVFGARRVDGVEINPIIANDVMRDRFLEFSGGIYTHPKVRIFVDDGRSFVRRTPERYDVIQASLVDTWAATAAGAYTLTENSLYTVEAFDDYLDHLTDDGVLSITRWVFDGLRLVSLAQEACARRGWDSSARLVVVRHDRLATFLLKRSPFTQSEVARLRLLAGQLRFDVLFAPRFDGASAQDAASTDPIPDVRVGGTSIADYAKLITAADRSQFYEGYAQDIRPTTDNRPFFFHTTKLRDQFAVAVGRSMLFGNGLSALLTLMVISAGLVVLFIVGPLLLAGGWKQPRWTAWLVYFASLGAGFMLIEVSILQQFVLLLGHPVYSLTVTLFALLLGTGLGAALSQRVRAARVRRSAAAVLVLIAGLALLSAGALGPIVSWAVPFERPGRIAIAMLFLVPFGMALGVPMPAGIRLMREQSAEMLPWAWGINGAFSVVGATLAIFIAMNWGFRATLVSATCTYLLGLTALSLAARR